MRTIIISLLLLLSRSSFAQVARLDSIEICGRHFAVPTKCNTFFPHQLNCDSYFMNWQYVGKSMLKYLTDIYVNGETKEFISYKKDSINVLLLGEKVTAVKLTLKDENGLAYELVLYGTVAGQSIMLQLNLFQDFKVTKDLPVILQRIITIKD